MMEYHLIKSKDGVEFPTVVLVIVRWLLWDKDRMVTD